MGLPAGARSDGPAALIMDAPPAQEMPSLRQGRRLDANRLNAPVLAGSDQGFMLPRPRQPDHDGLIDFDHPKPTRRCTSCCRRAGDLAECLPAGCCRPTTAFAGRELALFPTGTGAPSRCVRRRQRRETLTTLPADHRAQPGSAEWLRAPRLHAAQPDGAAGRVRCAGRAGFPGRGVRARPSPMTSQLDARRLPQRTRIRARYHGALLAAGAEGRAAVDPESQSGCGGVDGLQRHLNVAGIFARLTLRDASRATSRHAALHRLHPRQRPAVTAS